MKYDRPVWQLMHACADELPETFRFSDVRDWFAENFPDVGDSTMRAHLVGLTEGGAEKQNQFRQRAPLFRRVSRGVYSVIPLSQRGESPHDRETTEPQPIGVRPVVDNLSFAAAGANQRADEHEPVQFERHLDGVWPSATVDRRVSAEHGATKEHGARSDHGPTTSGAAVARGSTVVVKRVGALKRWRASRRARRQAEAQPRSSDDSVVSPAGPEQADPQPQSTEPYLKVVRSPANIDADLVMGEATAADYTSGVSTNAPQVDAVLVGTGRDPVVVPVPAKNAFRDRSFLRDRRAAERSGAPWFLITADRGLLRPDEWVTPDDDQSAHRAWTDDRKWAQMVAAKLASAIGPLSGRSLHVSADDSMATTVIDVLSSEGARVSRGPVPVPTVPADPSPAVSEIVSATSQLDTIVQALTDTQEAVPASSARGLPGRPGLYAWLIDEAGAATLSESLQLSVVAGPLYVGQAGAYEGFGEASASLNDHINLLHLYGSSRRSAFRSHLATALAEPLTLSTIDDARLTRWMVEHLSVTFWPVDDVASLPDLKAQVLGKLHTPLNFERTNSGVFYERMTVLRARLA